MRRSKIKPKCGGNVHIDICCMCTYIRANRSTLHKNKIDDDTKVLLKLQNVRTIKHIQCVPGALFPSPSHPDTRLESIAISTCTSIRKATFREGEGGHEMT